MSIGGNIKAFREERGWTQEQLAARMGVDRVSVTHWESGVSVPRMGNVEKLAALFGVKKSQIIDDRNTYMHVRLPDEQEQLLLDTFRMLDAVQKQTVLDVARGLAGVAKSQNIEQVG